MNSREELIQRLLASDAAGRGHHAYLLSGPAGAGVNAVVERLAATWMSPSENDFQNTHSRVQRKIHPDLVWIQPEGRTLKVDEIRDLPRQLGYAPLEARKRVVVLADAEKMSVSAANALLKSLEEPPESARFVLLVEDANRVLETIRSRCQLVRVPPMTRSEIIQELQNQYSDRDKFQVLEAAALSGGSQSRAEAYLENEEDQKLVHRSLAALLESWKKPYMVPSSCFAFLEATKRFDQANLLVQAWTAQLSDLMRIRESKRLGIQCNDKELVFARYRSEVEGFVEAEGADSPRLQVILDRSGNLATALRALDGNANVRLLMTTLFSELQAGHVREGSTQL